MNNASGIVLFLMAVVSVITLAAIGTLNIVNYLKAKTKDDNAGKDDDNSHQNNRYFDMH